MRGTDTKLLDEAGRIAALRRYDVLDTPREAGFDRITGLVSTVLNVPMAAVSLIDTERQWFKSNVGLAASETRRDVSFCTYTIKEREPFHVPDAQLDPRFSENPLVTGEPFIRSYLGVPLSTPDGYNVGSLCAIDVIPRSYSPAQVEILKTLGSLVVDELELRRIAQVDHLTGAATRRSFTLEMEKALSNFKRTGRAAALLMLDIDHFKKINDTHGHSTGDFVLCAVAKAIAGQLRRNELLGRLGGEEFGILLYDVSPEQALDTAERLRASLPLLRFPEDPPLQVTASFGSAALDSGIRSNEEWLALTDEALYDAKRTGRNRCCAARTTEAEFLV